MPLPRAKRVLILALDGVRLDHITPQLTPHLLSSLTAYQDLDALTSRITVSQQGWLSALTGHWPDTHQVLEFEMRGCAKPTLFDYAQHSLVMSQWDSMLHFCCMRGVMERVVKQQQQQHNTRRISVKKVTSDDDVVDELMRRFEQQQDDDDFDVIFAHFDDVDATGHEHGWASEEYVAAVRRMDDRLKRVLDVVFMVDGGRRSRGEGANVEDDWLVIAVSDHGGGYSLLL